MATALRQQKYPFGSLRTDPHWSTKGLVFYPQFKPAGKLIDESPYKNHGVITGATWVGDGLFFSGTSGKYVNLGNPSHLELYSDFTVIVAYRDITGTYNMLCSKMDGGGHPIQITYWSSNTKFRVDGNDSTDAAFNTAEVDGNSSSGVIAVTVSDSLVSLYVDGRFGDSVAITGGLRSRPSYNWYLGARNAGDAQITGTITGASIYNRILSASEIQQLTINADLPMQQYPAWWGKAGVAPSGIVPIIQAHTRRRRAG